MVRKGRIALAVESELSDPTCKGKVHDFDKLMHVIADVKLFVAGRTGSRRSGSGSRDLRQATARYLKGFSQTSRARHYLVDYSSQAGEWFEYRSGRWISA